MALTWEFYVAIILVVIAILIVLLFVFLMLNPGSNIFDRLKMSLGFGKKVSSEKNQQGVGSKNVESNGVGVGSRSDIGNSSGVKGGVNMGNKQDGEKRFV